MSFGDDVNRFAQDANRSVERTIRGAELRLFTAVIMDTPVGNPDLWQSPAPEGYVGGRLRGNWQTSTAAPATGTSEEPDPSGAETLSAVQAFISALQGGQVTFLSNNLPYAVPVEYGHSTQAPEGMVRKNIARFQRLIDAEAKEHQV